MLRTIIVLLAVAALACPALAQGSAPFVGQVKGTNVYVRGGPGQNFYPMTRLSAPARVSVVSVEAGWAKIVPPPGVFSLVSKRYVTADGADGTINADNVRIRAGSDVQPSAVDVAQMILAKGAKVRIVGQTEEYYKIEPPQGVTVYISADFLEQVPGAVPSGLEAVTRPAGEVTPVTPATPPGPAASRPTPTTGRAPRPVPPPEPTVSDEATKAFNQAEAAFDAEYKKPAAQRDLQKVLSMYKALPADPSGKLKPYVDYKVSYLELDLARSRGALEAEAVVQQAKDKLAESERQLAILRAASQAAMPTAYAAQGKLTPSNLFSGEMGSPRRWTVRDEYIGQVVAFAQCTTGKVDLEKYEGMTVGLIGTRQYVQGLQRYVVEVDKVVTLSGAGAPPPTRPAPLTPTSAPAAPKPDAE